jgi:hypothetical protein
MLLQMFYYYFSNYFIAKEFNSLFNCYRYILPDIVKLTQAVYSILYVCK